VTTSILTFVHRLLSGSLAGLNRDDTQVHEARLHTHAPVNSRLRAWSRFRVASMASGVMSLSLFLDHDIEQVVNMKLILCIFEQLSGLKINFHKSELFLFW
jgi:hypothetical protein